MSPTKKLILRYLAETPGQTPEELAEQLGIVPSGVRKHLTAMHDARPRLVRISSWGTVHRGFYGTNPVGRWSLGEGRHALRPKPKTGAELTRIYRAKLSAPDRQLERALTR